MLSCIPQSLCSWNYRILDGEAIVAFVTFDFWTEQGSISLRGIDYAIRKHGMFSGHWSVESPAGTYVDGVKPSAMFRQFELNTSRGQLALAPESIIGRGFSLMSSTGLLGTIRPMHPFTCRASIECSGVVSELDQLFAFWLVVLTWRRAAKRRHHAV